MLVRTDYLPPVMAPRPAQFHHPFTVPATHLADHPDLQQAFHDQSMQQKRNVLKTQREEDEFPKSAQDLFDLIALYPYTPTSRLWPKLDYHISPAAQKAARKALEDAKLVVFMDERFSSTNQQLPDPTEKAYQRSGRDKPKIPGLEGNILHRYLQRCVSSAEENGGRKTTYRWPVPGTSHTADVMVIDEHGRRHAVECVSTCETNLNSHIRACLIESDTVATVTIVATQKRTLDRIRKDLFGDPEIRALSDRIFFKPALEYLEACFP